MALMLINQVTFAYEGSYDDVFTGLTCQLDTRWRLGLIGRNGRGKTTLLRLLAGELHAQGSITMPLAPVMFPFPIINAEQSAMAVMLACAPQTPAWRLELEASLLNIGEETLQRPYATLSRGEQTKAQLAALFAREDTYPLIDEPTNHLDLTGREMVADYLAGKDGFLLVSHDRAFLNRCIDHTLSLNRTTAMVQRGDFDLWEREFTRKNESEQARNQQIQKDVARLTQSARQKAEWSKRTEKAKYHVKRSEAAVADRGYIGARAAAMMKRSLNVQARIDRQIEEKRTLLQDLERVGELKLFPLEHPKRQFIEVVDGFVRYDGRTICEGIQINVTRGARIALMGRNGAGKSSILRGLCGAGNALMGDVRIASGLKVSYVPQSTDHLRGSLRSFIQENDVDETLFKAILRNMDFGREQFDKAIEHYSEGQKKKLMLARSLCEQAHLYVWDEPLNYLDVFSRMQLETLILSAAPTMVLVEHDRAFLDRVCTQTIDLDGFTKS